MHKQLQNLSLNKNIEYYNIDILSVELYFMDAYN
jgi:hypothetical protein